MGMISVCRSYFLVDVDSVVLELLLELKLEAVEVILAVVETVESVTTVVVDWAVVAWVVEVFLGLAVQATFPAWSQVIREAEYRVPSLQVIRWGTPPAHR